MNFASAWVETGRETCSQYLSSRFAKEIAIMLDPIAVFGTPEKPIQIISSNVLSVLNKVGPLINDRHGCSILKKGEPPDFKGSGTFIDVSGRLFVATAMHIIEKMPSSEPYRIEWNADSFGFDFYRQDVIESVNLDIAAIRVPAVGMPPSLLKSGKICSLSSSVDNTDDFAMILGVSGKQIAEDHDTKTIVMPVQGTAVARLPVVDWPILDDGARLYFHYSKQYAMDGTGKSMTVVDPKGWSGGGVWTLSPQMELSSPPDTLLEQVTLCGIVFGVDEDHWRYIGATRIEKWLELVKGKN